MAYNPSFNRDARGNYQAHRNAGFFSVQAGTDAYLMEDEINELQWLQNEARATILREVSHSGFLDLGYDDRQVWFNGVYSDGSTNKVYPNALLLHPNTMRLAIQGYTVNASFDNITTYNSNKFYTLQLPSAPASNQSPATQGSARDDLVFIEAWFKAVDSAATLKENGNLLNNGLTNDLIDVRVGAETTQRVQLRWNIRVVPGVDFTKSPDGFKRYGDTSITSPSPLCDLSMPNANYAYHQANPVDDPNVPQHLYTQKGVYVAGDGSVTAQQGIGSVDGFAYAVPVFCIRRRNSQPYDAMTNPLGATSYAIQYNVDGQTNPYPANTVTFNLKSVTSFTAGQQVVVNGAVSTYYTTVTSVNSNNNTLTVADGLPSAQLLTSVEVLSDRPDGLFNNVIDVADIVDLRHLVGPRVRNFKQVMQQGLDKLLRGELTTAKQKSFARDFVGLPAFNDDASTLLLAHMDGNANATANGANVPVTAPGNLAYVNGVIGQAANVPKNTGMNNGIQYTVNVPSNLSTLTIEFLFKPTWVLDGSSYGLFELNDATQQRNLSLDFNSATNQFECKYRGTSNTTQFKWNVPTWLLMNLISSTRWHKLMFSFASTGNLTLVVDNVALTSVNSTTYPGPFATNNVTFVMGYSGDTNTTISAVVEELRMSSIIRSETQLPASFSGYNRDGIVTGPTGVDQTWGEDRTNMGGLNHVANMQTVTALYNGTRLDHYLKALKSWNPVYINSVTNDPTNAMEPSALSWSVNVVAPSGQSSYTFNNPGNPPISNYIFLTNMNQTAITNVSSGTSLSSVLAVDNNFNIIATPAASVLTGTSLSSQFMYGGRHIHMMPSTKGFEVHNWADDAFSIQYLDNPNSAPTLAAASGTGSLASGTTYYVKYSWYSTYGETMASPEALITLLPGNSAIAVSTPALPNGAVGIKVYVSTTADSEQLDVITTSNNVNITSMPAGGAAAVPASNTAQITNKTYTLANRGKVLGINHVRVKANGSTTSYIVTQAGLSNTTPGAPSWNIPSWSVTDGSGNPLTLPNLNACITFNGLLPANAIVDVVYEYAVVPATADNLVIHYETTPYQGLFNGEVTVNSYTRLPIVEVMDYLLVNTNGTGTPTPNAGTPTLSYKYVPVSTKLPLGLTNVVTNTGSQLDSVLTNTTISLSTDAVATSFAQQVVGAKTMRNLPYTFGVALNADGLSMGDDGYGGGSFALVGAELRNFSSMMTPRGIAGTNTMLVTQDGSSAQFVLYHPQAFTSSFSKQVIFGALVHLKDFYSNTNYHDELVLLVASRIDNTATASIGFKHDWTDVAFDIFHLSGRPLLR